MKAFSGGVLPWVLSVLLLTPTLSSFAQTQKYSLSDFIDSAWRHLPVLLQKKALVDAAQAGVKDARHAFLPSSYLGDEVNVGTDNSIPGSYISFGVIPSSSSGVRSANTYQSAIGNIAFVYNQYELLDFGLKKATVGNAQAYANLSQADLDRERYLVEWQIGKLYLEILKNQFQLGIDRENIARYETIYRVIHAVTLSGIKPGADSALALAELSKTRIVFNQTLGAIRQLQQQLSYLTGIGMEQISIDTSAAQSFLSAPGGPGFMGDKATPGDTLTLRDKPAPGNPFGPENGLTPPAPGTPPVPANPLTDYYDKEKFLYRQTEELVKKSYLPKVLLTGVAWARGSSIDYQDNYKSAATGLGYQRFNYMGGLTLQYNLFNIVHRRDKESIARNNLLASDYALQQQQLSLQNVGNKAGEALRTAIRNLAEIPVQTSAAEDAFHQKTAQYRAGIINLVDLTNASFVLYRSQSDYVQTLSDWLLASLDKAASTGNLSPFLQSIK